MDTFKLEDFAAMEPIARCCFDDFKYPGTFDWKTFSTLWMTAIENGTGVIIRAQDKAVLGMAFGPDQFNGWKTAMVNFWFVKPEHRHTGLGRELLRCAEHVARGEDCWRILMGHPVGHVKFFQQMGFTPMEVGYHKIF